MPDEYQELSRGYAGSSVIDPLRPLTPEELELVVLITDEEIDAALEQGRREAAVWDMYLYG
ncbi:hypothetical protein HZB90_05000 [archaeon]|nr:hypothetical protein [archaeon]